MPLRAAAWVCAVALAGCATPQKAPPPSADQRVANEVKERVEAVLELRERALKLKHESTEVAQTTRKLQAKRMEVSQAFVTGCEPKVSSEDECAAMSQAWVEADVSLLRSCEAERVQWQQWLKLNDDTMKLNQALASLEPECPQLSDEQARKACDDLAWEGKGRLQFKDDVAQTASANSEQIEQLCELVKREAELLRARALKRGY